MVAEFLTFLGGASALGAPGAATLFVTRVGFMLHTQHHIDKLSGLLSDLRKQITILREAGTLIDSHDERTLWVLFERIEAFLEVRNVSKAELLRRVALGGLIQRDVDAIKERDFGYVVSILEPEDIQTLHECKRVFDEVEERLGRPRQRGPDGLEPTSRLPEGLEISSARLVAAGLVIFEPRWGAPVPVVTRAGKDFMSYIATLPE